MTSVDEISKIEIERDDARQDLRDTLAEVNDRVEQAEDEMRPTRLIERHVVGCSLLAGAFGFFYGSIVKHRGAGAVVIAALFGVAISKYTRPTTVRE